ncbi:hypothetical protein [Labilithrix luteola]|uniref:hypothetical protein n=1 Tax=Labilithrix luteola TaxID=1391654 RepID=UPI0011BAC5F0
MRSHRLHLFLALAAGSAVLLAIAACSSSETPSFVDAPDGAGETGASLPPAQSDATIPGDAGTNSDVSAPPIDESVECSVTPCVTQIAAGTSHYCARISDGTVRCWGNNSRGQLGLGQDDGGFSADAGPNPGTVEGLTDVVQVDVQSGTSCAVSKDGAVKCWGDNATGASVRSPEAGVRTRPLTPCPRPSRSQGLRAAWMSTPSLRSSLRRAPRSTATSSGVGAQTAPTQSATSPEARSRTP